MWKYSDIKTVRLLDQQIFSQANPRDEEVCWQLFQSQT